MKQPELDFEYSEDRDFFDDLFRDHGGVDQNNQHFDFRDPAEKRAEFNKIRKSVFADLQSRVGNICQLGCHPDCEGTGTQVDHLIPLSSNVLNKEIRRMKGADGKKVKTQSFGSNDKSNFILACARCNAFKKHRFPSRELINRIKNNRNGLQPISPLGLT
ncbi:MAG: HNH endonuclease [Pontiellaceae bacterium]|nr:HNH endonuclease [Pontiellaceae bacterium]